MSQESALEDFWGSRICLVRKLSRDKVSSFSTLVRRVRELFLLTFLRQGLRFILEPVFLPPAPSSSSQICTSRRCLFLPQAGKMFLSYSGKPFLLPHGEKMFLSLRESVSHSGKPFLRPPSGKVFLSLREAISSTSLRESFHSGKPFLSTSLRAAV